MLWELSSHQAVHLTVDIEVGPAKSTNRAEQHWLAHLQIQNYSNVYSHNYRIRDRIKPPSRLPSTRTSPREFKRCAAELPLGEGDDEIEFGGADDDDRVPVLDNVVVEAPEVDADDGRGVITFSWELVYP